MKENKSKNILLLSTIIVCIIIARFWIGEDSDSLKKSINISSWNNKVQLIQSGNKSYNRAIASVRKKTGDDPPRKSSRVIPSWMMKKKIIAKHKEAKDRSYKYESMFPGSRTDFTNGVSKYRFLDNFYAFKNTPSNRAIYPNSKIKLNYIIVQSEINISDKNSLSVVENDETGHFGIFTGVLKVKLKDLKDIDFLIDHGDYEIKKIYEHINVVEYRIDDVVLAVQTNSKVQSNPKIVRASLEILEYARDNR